MQPQTTRRHVRLALVLGAVVVAVAAIQWAVHSMRSGELARVPRLSSPKVSLLPQPRALPDFQLTSHRGAPFGAADLKGAWTFLFFGYTHCPDVCPTTLTVLNGVAQQLEKGHAGLPRTQFVFVSVDPGRDTVEQLGRYIPYFNREFIGLTGSDAQINALTQTLGIMHAREPGGDASDYQIRHAASVLLLDPASRWHATFAAPHNSSEIAVGFREIYRAYQDMR